MAHEPDCDPETFHFRGLHRQVSLGTASDRYVGWIGQVYQAERYLQRLTRRTHLVGGKTFIEEVLPIDSVGEYFAHFAALELDFTFYHLLLDSDGRPSQNYRVVEAYRRFLKEGDRVLVKVPQVVFAQKLWRDGRFQANDAYLQPDIFSARFHRPIVELLGDNLRAMIFEQEYQRKQDRVPPPAMASALDHFFRSIPQDTRYHVELRTDSYLVDVVFAVFAQHGVGQVLSHWTWLPPLAEQFARSGRRFLNSGKECVVRLMTPRGMRYEDAYARAHPFSRLVPGMVAPRMIDETVALMHAAVEAGVHLNVIVNNRAGGNAPLIAQMLAGRFLADFHPQAP
jgi:uncharacterized protein YecE (DUF72 family)